MEFLWVLRDYNAGISYWLSAGLIGRFLVFSDIHTSLSWQ